MVKNQKEQNLKYQWLKGENMGIIEQYKTISDDGFIVFESGRRINPEVLDEFMVQVNTDADILNFNITKSKTYKDLEAETKLSYENKQIDKYVELKSPIVRLLEKQSKNNIIKFDIEISLNIPKKEVVTLLQDSFEEDVIQEIINFSKDTLNKEGIISKIYSKIEENIKKYYSYESKEKC